jgi:hypothetical protein
VGNAIEECIDADCDCQNNQGEKADGYEEYAKDFCRAAGAYQHRGASVSVVWGTAEHHQQGLLEEPDGLL